MMIKHITLGTKEVFFFNYEGEQLPLRPISSYELDQCFFNALYDADEEIAKLVVDLKLGLIKATSYINYDNKKLANLKKYFDDIDYWIVYYGVKDYQELEFQAPDKNGHPTGFNIIRKMRHIHEIASKILNYSYQPREVIQEIIKSEEGKLIGTVTFSLNVPLAEASEMTKLQRDFLILSKIDRNKAISKPKRTISKTGDKINLLELMGKVINE